MSNVQDILKGHDDFMRSMHKSNAQHTPGPWRYERTPDNWVHCVRAHVWGPTVTIQAAGNLDYTEPDMRLIAAAPQLLAALEKAERTIASINDAMTGSLFAEELVEIRAAIAAAKGEQA